MAVLGGAIGLLFAVWACQAFKAAAPESLPRLSDVSIDLPVLLVTMGATALSGILSGLVPAWQMTQPDLEAGLKSGDRQVSGGLTSHRFRNLLMVTELALALLLLIACSLLVKSFRNLAKDDRGYDPQNILNFRMRLADMKYPDPEQAIVALKEIQRRLSRVPGVQRVAVGTAVPLGRFVQGNYWIEGQPEPQTAAQWPLATSLSVSEGYQDALGIRLLAGRGFHESDEADTPAVVMVDDQFVQRNFPGASYDSILGRRLRFDGSDEPWREIIGIVRHVKYHSPEEEPLVQIYRPWTQMNLKRSGDWLRAMDVVIKTSLDPWSILPAVRREVAALDPDQPLGPVITFASMLEKSMAPRRMNLMLITVFAGSALVLSTVGLYGVLSYLAGQRRREIGVRVALGAQRRHVLRLIMGNGAALALAGTVFGVAGAFALMRLMSSLLYGVSATDPVIYAGISLLLMVIALTASYLPARRAARVDPIEALRCE